MNAFYSGLLGGVIAWVATTFVGAPLVAFLALRGQCATALAKFREDEIARDARPNPPPEWWHDRNMAYRNCGSNLSGFAASNQVFCLALQRWLGKFRVDPKRAGDDFVKLGGIWGGPQSRPVFDRVAENLRLKF